MGKIKKISPDTGVARKCRDRDAGPGKLGLGKDHSVEAVVIEEGVSHADLGKGGADQVLSVTRIGPVVNPPVEGLLSAERGKIAVDIFRDRSGSVACVGNTRPDCGAICACMDINLMAGNIVGVPLCCLGELRVDRVGRQTSLRSIVIQGADDLR